MAFIIPEVIEKICFAAFGVFDTSRDIRFFLTRSIQSGSWQKACED